jgi:hypothetical protein
MRREISNLKLALTLTTQYPTEYKTEIGPHQSGSTSCINMLLPPTCLRSVLSKEKEEKRFDNSDNPRFPHSTDTYMLRFDYINDDGLQIQILYIER